MSLYPSLPKPISFLIIESIKKYGAVLKAIFPLILLLAVVKDLYFYFGGMPKNTIAVWVIILVMVLMEVYLLSAAILGTHKILSGSPGRLNQTCRETFQKVSSIYAGFFALIIILCVLFFIGYGIAYLLSRGSQPVIQNLLMLFFIGVPITYSLVMFFFVIPSLIVESVSVTTAFRQSFSQAGYTSWLRAFSCYAAFLVFFFVLLPSTRHGVWLVRYHVIFIFDVVMLSIFLPLLLNYLLFMLNDLKLRSQQQDK